MLHHKTDGCPTESKCLKDLFSYAISTPGESEGCKSIGSGGYLTFHYLKQRDWVDLLLKFVKMHGKEFVLAPCML